MATQADVDAKIRGVKSTYLSEFLQGRSQSQYSRLCSGLRAEESVLAVLVGIDRSAGSGTFMLGFLGSGLLLITDRRVGAIVKAGPQWYDLNEVGFARSTLSKGILVQIGGTLLGKRIELHDVGGTHDVGMVVRFLRSKGEDHSLAATATKFNSDALVASTRATYLGGTIVGNLRRAHDTGDHAQELAPKFKVDVWLRQNDVLEVGQLSSGKVFTTFMSYPVTSQSIALDSSAHLARALRGGWLTATVAATVLVGPIGLLGLLKSTQSSTKEAFVLLITDGPDQGAFALVDGTFARKVLARRATLGAQSGSYEAFLADAQPPHLMEVPESAHQTTASARFCPKCVV